MRRSHCRNAMAVSIRISPTIFRNWASRATALFLAFAPKAAGTYLRSACITAVNGASWCAPCMRKAAVGTPVFICRHFLPITPGGGFPERTLVTHVHMQALPANRHFIEALNLKPVIMIRSIPDMLASYLDMLEGGPLLPDNWLNISVPRNYAGLTDSEKADFIIDMMAPWYASYFSTWMDYAFPHAGAHLHADL